MSNWKYLNTRRVGSGAYASDESFGFNGMFHVEADGCQLRCIASDGGGWQHVSVSQLGSKHPPRWGVMCAIKDLFFEDEDWVVQFHPAKSEYVNNHEGCLHLWRCTESPQPTPPAIFTGIKGASAVDPETATGCPDGGHHLNSMTEISCPHCRGSGRIPDMAALGASMRKRRHLFRVSLDAMAAALGVNRATVSKWESGVLPWKQQRLEQYEAVLVAATEQHETVAATR